jgi:hypothetical protein
MAPGAAAFYRGRFSAVRTLSPKSTALIAVSELPISVPYHSVIGQLHPGPKEQGSDGVVPYWSSHLAGAQSELIVRSGHGVIDNSDAIREVIRILHLEQRFPKPPLGAVHRLIGRFLDGLPFAKSFPAAISSWWETLSTT